MAKPPANRRPYFLIAGGCLLAGLIVGWVPLASQVDSYHYDWMMRLYPPPSPAKDSLILEIDDHSLREFKGMRNIRPALARALMLLADGKPKAVAIDLILAEESDEKGDPLLAEAMRRTRNLVLSADLTDADAWEQPDALFLPAAAAVGHVHADPDSYDGVSRQVQLEKIGNRIRLWALALEAYKLSIGASDIVETPSDLQVGDQVIPVPRRVDRGRPMFIRYRKGHIPRVPLRQLLADPKLAARFDGKVVFIGVTSQSQARDTLVTPISTTIQMPGVEIHAHIYEAIAQRDFLWPAGNLSVLMAASLLVLFAAIVFAFLNGKLAYGIGALVILAAHGLPHLLFPQGIIFPLMAPAACAWLSVLGCASYQYFATRRELRESEAGRSRYQEAIHFVSHEMRSPLTAIQGSSEMMSRYNLPEEKRKHISQMINSESKRLARMIQTFLDVERLSEGQMELKRELFSLQDVAILCVERARPLAEKKRIGIHVAGLIATEVLGDRELMEYAVYNLLTNAIKYSPPDTEVQIEARRDGDRLRVAVRDQGIGMDEKELKKIGTKFYRTRRAEQSGEVGTGIGLSLVHQIVRHHGGKLDIASAPGHGSCFTIVVPVAAPARAGEVKR